MAVAIDCKTCVHEKVCDLWVQQERQDASCFCLDGCDYFEPTLTPPNEPLTLEQLREMDGEPVWLEDVKHWALIDIEKGGKWDGIPFAIWAENGVNFTWNVENRDLHCYRRPPEGEEEEKHVIEITENL